MKTKISIIITIVILTILGAYFFQQNKVAAPILTPNSAPVPAPAQAPVEKSAPEAKEPEFKSVTSIEGKLRSMNEKQIYIELQDGTGSAINIKPAVGVKKEGEENVGNLADLKIGDILKVEIDGNINAKEILIKK